MSVIIYANHPNDPTLRPLTQDLSIDDSQPFGVFPTIAVAKDMLDVESWACGPLDVGYSYQFIQFSVFTPVKRRVILRKKAV